MPIHYAALHHERSVLRGKAGLSPVYPEDLANEPVERLEPLPYRPADHARDKYLAVTIASKPGSTWNLLGGSPQASSRNSAAAGLQRQGTMGSWSLSFRLARDYQRHLSAGLKLLYRNCYPCNRQGSARSVSTSRRTATLLSLGSSWRSRPPSSSTVAHSEASPRSRKGLTAPPRRQRALVHYRRL
jgi:hypothetical protein